MFTKIFDFCSENRSQYSEDKLSIYLQTNRFSFSLQNKEKGLVHLCEYEGNFPSRLSESMASIKGVFGSVGITTFAYPSITTIFHTNKQTWIPEELFDENHISKYLKFICKIDDNEHILTYYCKLLKAFSIFAVDQHLYSAFKVTMPLASFQSQHSVLVEKGFQLCNNYQNTVVLSIQTNSFDIIAFKEDNFILSNSFKFESQDELLYLLLNVLKQLQFNLNETRCYLSGMFNEPLLNIIRTFIPNADVVPFGSETDSFSDKINLSKHFLIL